MTALVSAGLAGCSGGGNGDGNGTETLPELDLSGEQVESSVSNLSVTGYETELLRGQQHDDIHFAVTPTIENTGDQEANLGDYAYDITLFSAEGDDITPGSTWAINPETVAPGETGTILVQVSFISAEGVDPEDVDSYEVSISCGEDGGAYC